MGPAGSIPSEARPAGIMTARFPMRVGTGSQFTQGIQRRPANVMTDGPG
jgi:hypothetical protein